MRIRISTFTFIICQCFFTSYSSAMHGDKNPYAVFDETIYNQQEIRPYLSQHIKSFQDLDLNEKNNSLEEKKRKARVEKTYSVILECLAQKKLWMLESTLFKTFDQELANLEKLEKKYKLSTPQKIRESSKVFLTALSNSSFVMLAFNSVTSVPIFVAGVIGATAVISAGILEACEIYINKPNGLLEIDKLRDKAKEAKLKLIQGIVNENGISDLEVKYVLKKHLIKNNTLKREIETALITLRHHIGFGPEHHRRFIIDALKLPFEKKEIMLHDAALNFENETLTTEQEQGLSANQIEARNIVISYAPPILKELSRMATQIKYASYDSDPVPSHRRFYFVEGTPGTGKTTAIKAIANLFEFSLYEPSLTAAADLREETLEGGDWHHGQRRVGLFVDTLLKEYTISDGAYDADSGISISIRPSSLLKYELPSSTLNFIVPKNLSERTYKNSILLLNDFDRHLSDLDRNPQALSFLLAYLDPTRTTFFSRYFNADIDFRDLTIVITGNTDLSPHIEETFFQKASSIMSSMYTRTVPFFRPMFQFNPSKNATLEEIIFHNSPVIISFMCERAASVFKTPFKINHLTVETDDPLSALRDRLVDIKFQDFNPAQKHQILSLFLKAMKTKYKFEGDQIPHETEETSIKQALMFPTLRKGKKYIEQEVLDLRIRQPLPAINGPIVPFIPIGNDLPIVYKSPISEFIFCPHFDQETVRKKVNTLEESCTAAKLLFSDTQIEQWKGIESLLGSIKSSGFIEYLWKTNTWKTNANFENLNALYARLARFEFPDQKYEALQFHLQLIQYIMEGLLNLSPPLSTSTDPSQIYIYQKIKEDFYKQSNLKKFWKHIKKLEIFEEIVPFFLKKIEIGRLEELELSTLKSFGPKEQELLQNFKLWVSKKRQELIERDSVIRALGLST